MPAPLKVTLDPGASTALPHPKRMLRLSVRHVLVPLALRRGFKSGSSRSSSKRRWYTAGGLLLAGGGVYASSESVRDNVDFAVHGAQRSTTVAVALVRCVLAYRSTLNASYPDEESRDQALRECHTKCAVITRHALERNAGVFIKLGQHISALTYIFPVEWTSAMVPLQDQCPESSIESVEQLFRDDTGQDIRDIFAEFSPRPMGTASLAQVHRATLKDNGQEVAVKVQHPSLQRYVPLDIRLTATVFRMVDYFFPEYPLQWLSDEMKRSIYVELNFTEEAENARKTAAYFANYYKETALRIPNVYWAKPRILCMEFVQGIRPDDVKALVQAGVDRKDLSSCFAHLFNNMIFTPNVGLHCDPHAGNIAIRTCPRTKDNKHGFEVVLYDHGLYRYVETSTRRAYAHFWLALMDNDKSGMRLWAKKFAEIDDDDFKIFAAAITGRDFDAATDGSAVTQTRSPDEIRKMQNAIQSDRKLTARIMQMLHKMPPVVLLILKTNDLVRYLDEALGSPLGMTRQFVIMAHYCARTVFDEQLEQARSRGFLGKWLGFTSAWIYRLWTDIRLAALPLIMG